MMKLRNRLEDMTLHLRIRSSTFKRHSTGEKSLSNSVFALNCFYAGESSQIIKPTGKLLLFVQRNFIFFPMQFQCCLNVASFIVLMYSMIYIQIQSNILIYKYETVNKKEKANIVSAATTSINFQDITSSKSKYFHILFFL